MGGPLIRLERVALAFGHHPLLDRVSLELHAGERVCLVGRNGAGKSSLLKLVAGELAADEGGVWRRSGLSVAQLQQEVQSDSLERVFDVVASGIPEQGRLLMAYHDAADTMARDPSPEAARRLGALQHDLEISGGWRIEQRVETVLSRLQLEGSARMDTLSGGWRRRVSLARALVREPELLLLDEPTNHLDIEAITWLEGFLAGFRGAVLFITHDRIFARRLVTRVLDLDRGSLSSWPGGYDHYVRGKAERLLAEERADALLDKHLSEEEAWIRQGIKARRTRNEGRVRALEALRERRSQRRERVGRAEIRVEEAESSGRVVFACEHVHLRRGGRPLLTDFSTRILRGDRVGIIGPNGSGKTSLIRLLLGGIPPDSGRVVQGARLQPAYFDQQREALDPARTVMDSVVEGGQTVRVDGRSQHVAGYLRGFLFPPQRLMSPVGTLSGGERNRLMLARIFARPANVLVLDEPTNDLDVETLELLEERVQKFEGTLLLVSHDREFIDNVVTSTLVLEGDGRVGEYVGGYSDWTERASALDPGELTPQSRTPEASAAPRERGAGKEARPPKLSYMDQRELDALPGRIEALEAEQVRIGARVNSPGFYAGSRETVAETLAELERVGRELDACYERWESLENGPGS